MEKSFDVFISYKREEQALADQVSAALRQRGYSVLTDQNIEHGKPFAPAIDAMLRAARCVLVLWTEAAAKSEWVLAEAEFAADPSQQTYLGVLLDPVDLLFTFRRFQNIDLTGVGLPAGLDLVQDAVALRIGQAKLNATEADVQSHALNEDDITFRSAERLQTREAYLRYLEKFPNGLFADVARKEISRIDSIGAKIRRWFPIPSIAALSLIVAVIGVVFTAMSEPQRQQILEQMMAIFSGSAAPGPTPGETALSRAQKAAIQARTDLEAKESELEEVQMSLETANETIDRQSSELDELRPLADQNEALAMQLEEAKQDVAAANDEAADAQRQLQEEQVRFQDLEAQLQQAIKAKRDLELAASTHAEEMQASSDRIAALEGELGKASRDLSTAEVAFKIARGRAEAAEEKLAAALADVKRLEAQIADVAERRQENARQSTEGLSLAERQRIQTVLASAGYDPGIADGYFGPSTREAIRAFQTGIGEEATGYMTALQHQWLLLHGTSGARKPGERFRDCPECPELVVIPGGYFLMGSPPEEQGRHSDEGPQHVVNVPAFAIGRTEVTFAQWDACVAGGGCEGYRPSDRGWGRGQRPVINVSWKDAQTFGAWLNGKVVGSPYRLPSEAEWEYAARSSSTRPFWWGDTVTSKMANYNANFSYILRVKGEYRGQTVPVEMFDRNLFGLYQVHGNVWEWVQDAWHGTYDGAPSDGSAWTEGDDDTKVLRGGSWGSEPKNLRAAYRRRNGPEKRGDYAGFRVARTLTP